MSLLLMDENHKENLDPIFHKNLVTYGVAVDLFLESLVLQPGNSATGASLGVAFFRLRKIYSAVVRNKLQCRHQMQHVGRMVASCK